MDDLPFEDEDPASYARRKTSVVRLMARLMMLANRDSRRCQVERANQVMFDMTEYRDHMTNVLLEFYQDAWNLDGNEGRIPRNAFMVSPQIHLLQCAVEFLHFNLKMAFLGRISLYELDRLENAITIFREYFAHTTKYIRAEKRKQHKHFVKGLIMGVVIAVILCLLMRVL